MCSRPSEFLLYVEMFLCAVFLLSPVLGCMTMSENYGEPTLLVPYSLYTAGRLASNQLKAFVKVV